MNENLKFAIKTMKQHHENVEMDLNHWFQHELFTWNWWILLGFTIIPWIIWTKIVDCQKILEILLVGTFTMIPTTYLDAIGVDLKFWIYPVRFTPRALPFDMCMVAVAFMLLYQYFKGWKSYFLALLMMALLFAFIGEPVSKIMHLVYYIKWKYFYSFLYYIILGVSVKLLVNKCRDLYIKES